MSDPTRLHRDPATGHADERMMTPPGAHPAEPGYREDLYRPGQVHPGSVWRAYDEALMADDNDYYDSFAESFDGGPELDEFDEIYGDEYFDEGDEGGSGVADDVLSIARDNPVGTALLAAGVAFLLAPRLERDDARAAMERARAQGRSMGVRADSRARGQVAEQRSRLRRGAHSARSRASEQSAKLRRRLARMRASVDEGTESLGSEARDRIVAARMRTLAARERALDHADRLRAQADDAARRGADTARESFREHPLLAGTLAVAAGAALAAALPRSRFEDSRLGALSDRLAREAEEIYERERATILGAARGAWQEARQMASEAGETVRENVPEGSRTAEAAEETVRDGTARIAEAARRGAREGG
jgi:hypothetical protein